MIQRFTVYRRNLSKLDTIHKAEHKNADDEPQFEGVIFTDGTVALRWLTPLASTSVWDSLEHALGVHGHPEYGTVVEWHDGEPHPAWCAQVDAYNATLDI
jgi:hypothetical protein